MSDKKLEEEVRQLRAIVFNMLNFTNIYVLVLDRNMDIKFANNSLAIDLGFKSYKELLGHCWLDFIYENEKTLVSTIHAAVSNGYENWKSKYGEFQNEIIGKNGENNFVYWFNSHINSKYNWMFSFGIKKEQKQNITMDSVRDYYKEIITKDRVMINSMRDVIGLRDKIIDTCKSNFVRENNEASMVI